MLSDARPLASAYPSAQGVSPQAQGALFPGRRVSVGGLSHSLTPHASSSRSRFTSAASLSLAHS